MAFVPCLGLDFAVSCRLFGESCATDALTNRNWMTTDYELK
jgi:hypothetical protein